MTPKEKTNLREQFGKRGTGAEDLHYTRELGPLWGWQPPDRVTRRRRVRVGRIKDAELDGRNICYRNRGRAR